VPWSAIRRGENAASGGRLGASPTALIDIGPAAAFLALLWLLPIIGPIVFSVVAACASKLATALALVVAITIPFGVISPFV